MKSESIIQQLRSIPLLCDLKAHELEDLAAVIERRVVKKGKCLMRSEEAGEFIMFIVSGELKVALSGSGGREFIVDILGPGDFFGELTLLTGEPRSADVEALEDSAILVLARRDFEKHILMNSGLSRALLRNLALRLRHTTLKAGDLALLDVYRRLARVLKSLSEKNHSAAGQSRVIEKRPTHRELAALSGTSREMVTRALRDLEMAGHIRSEGRRLILQSLPA